MSRAIAATFYAVLRILHGMDYSPYPCHAGINNHWGVSGVSYGLVFDSYSQFANKEWHALDIMQPGWVLYVLLYQALTCSVECQLF